MKFLVFYGKKIYLNDLNSWLSSSIKNKKNFTVIKSKKIIGNDNSSFYLNNNKIKKKLGIKINTAQLKKECIKLSKKLIV